LKPLSLRLSGRVHQGRAARRRQIGGSFGDGVSRHLFQAFGEAFLERREQVPVHIECRLDAGVPKALEGAFQQAGLALHTEAYRNYEERGCAYRVLTA
jgi:hypothetical protein